MNMENNDGKTALMYVGREDYNKVKLLLDNEADVNMQNKYAPSLFVDAIFAAVKEKISKGIAFNFNISALLSQYEFTILWLTRLFAGLTVYKWF